MDKYVGELMGGERLAEQLARQTDGPLLEFRVSWAGPDRTGGYRAQAAGTVPQGYMAWLSAQVCELSKSPMSSLVGIATVLFQPTTFVHFYLAPALCQAFS